MWSQYQNLHGKTHLILQTIAPLLPPAVFARLWNVWSITDLSGTWKETKLSLPHHRPACTLGIFCPRGFYPEATRYCYFLWSRKGLRHNLEVWHLERLTRCWSTRPTPTFHSWFPLWQELPSQSWWKLFQTLWAGNGGTSGKHPICYFVLFEN